MLGIRRDVVDMLLDIPGRCREIVFVPVCSEDRGGILVETEDRLYLSFHRALLLRLHIVTDSIVLGGDVIFLAIAETVDGEVCLYGVPVIELIDTTDIPAETLIAHLIVCTACDVLTGLRTVRDLIGIVQAGVQGKMLTGCVGEFLTEDTGTVSSEVGCYRLLCLRIGALDVFQVVVLIAVSTMMCERGIGTDLSLIDVQSYTLRQDSVTTDFRVVGDSKL